MGDHPLLEPLLAAIAARRAARPGRMVVAGLCGAQGSGKTTLAAALTARLEAGGTRAATLSLDDLYHTRAERQALARRVHPLFVTRGVPGTHDVALGLATLAALDRGEAAPLPLFDKATDDRVPAAQWPHAPAPLAVLVLEGWCLGARPQAAAALADPVNPLERVEDADAIWRSHANRALAGDYQHLFARIDLLALLAAPDFAVVARWRDQAEQALRQRGAPGAMDKTAIARFVQHYERLTRHILAEMPDRADLVAWLDANRQVVGQGRTETRSSANFGSGT